MANFERLIHLFAEDQLKRTAMFAAQILRARLDATKQLRKAA
jgi:hypothetical protein